MGQEAWGSEVRLVHLSDEAAFDLANIDNATAAMWGDAQAERYLGFLSETLLTLAADPHLAPRVVQRP